MKPLIIQLFNKRKVNQIQKLYSEDPSSRYLIRDVIAKELLNNEKIIHTDSLIDVLGFILLNNSFGADDVESFQVALLIHKGLKFNNPIPSLIDDVSLDFSAKTLISLSWFRKKMESRTNRYGAPPIEYYRKLSKLILNLNEHYKVSDNHEKWENELSELFI